jgi:hypothetical protein
MMSPVQNVEKLLSDVSTLYKRRLHSPADHAPRFNLFRVLDIEDKEVSTHSAFIANLLNPREGHEQGDLFLRQFLLQLGDEQLVVFDDWVIGKEVPFIGGRLDIVLQSAKASAIIVIENKIRTEDHTNQLTAYREWLDQPHRKELFETRLLLYLTPVGEPAKNAPSSIYQAISYSGDITRWLSSCTVKASRVREAINTYLLTIGNLTTRTLMKDDIDDEIINLIKTPTKRTAALRIARVSNFLKEDILRGFWDRGEAYLNDRLLKEKLTYWSLDRTQGSPLQLRYEIGVVGNGVDTTKPHVRFSFFQFASASVFRWELAVKFDGWCGNHQKIKSLPEAKKLAEVLDGVSMPKKTGWDGWLLFTDDSKGIERTLEEEISKGIRVAEFFETGWQKFARVEPQLRQLNNAVLRM